MIIKNSFLRSPNVPFEFSSVFAPFLPPSPIHCPFGLFSCMLPMCMQYTTILLKVIAHVPVPGRSSMTSTKFKGKIPDTPLSSPLAHSSFTYSLRIIVSPSEKLSSSFWSPIYSNRAMHLGPLHKEKRNLLCLFIIIVHLIMMQHCAKYGLIFLIKVMKECTARRTSGKLRSCLGSYLCFLRRMSIKSEGAG